jgi:hypothetical protein
LSTRPIAPPIRATRGFQPQLAHDVYFSIRRSRNIRPHRSRRELVGVLGLSPEEIVRTAFEVFRRDADTPPPLTLRGGSAVDSYDVAEPFDPALDKPTDEYLEGFASFGVIYLDAQSWRHYLPRLIDYAFRKPRDPSMVIESLIRSLRPPDRYPPRLSSLDAQQEALVVAFLEAVALGGDHQELSEDAQQALEEWWLAGARHRPTAEQIQALRSAPTRYREVERELFALALPEGFGSSGARDIPEESRKVEVWSGHLCGDAPSVVAVNVTPASLRTLRQTLERASKGLRAASVEPKDVRVPGSRAAERLDGMTLGYSPAEPERIAMVAAQTGAETVLLTVRSWPREDVEAAIERIVGSFRLKG